MFAYVNLNYPATWQSYFLHRRFRYTYVDTEQYFTVEYGAIPRHNKQLHGKIDLSLWNFIVPVQFL